MATAKTAAKKAPGTAVAVSRKPNLPVDVAAQMAEEIAGFQSRLSAPGGDRIKPVLGKGFEMPNGDTADELSVIIVDFVSMNTLYDGAYNPNNITPPKCFAIGLEPTGMEPSANSPDCQSDGGCTSCWANQWKSATNGGAGKACGNSKVIAVIAPDGDVDSPLMLLKVSATAIKNFDAYVASVARTFQRPPRGVITTITLDPNVDYASVRFGNPQPCDKDQLALAYSRREEAMARLTAEPDVSSYEAPKQLARGKPAAGLQKPAATREAA